MTEKTKLKAKKRTVFGRKVKNLKKDGLIAGNVFGPKGSLALELDEKTARLIYQEVGDTGIVYLEIEGEKSPKPVLFEEVQTKPMGDEWLHVVLKEVNLKEKVEASVPVVLTGENKVPGVVLVTVHDEVEVEALPADLPKEFVIDIEKLTEPEQTVTFAELEYDREKVRLLIEEEEMSSPVVILQTIKEEVEVELDEAVEAEGEEASAEKEEQGEEKGE